MAQELNHIIAKELARRAAEYLRREEKGDPNMTPAYCTPYYRGRYEEVESLAISLGVGYQWWGKEVNAALRAS